MRRALLAAVCLGPLLAAPAPAAGDERSSELAALRRAIEEGRERVARYEREQRGALEAIEAVDRVVAALSAQVARARRETNGAQVRLAELEREAAQLMGRLADTRHAMRARALALYKAGDAGALRLLFSAGDLREFLSRVYALRRLLAHDADLLERHRRDSEGLAVAREGQAEAAERHAEALGELLQRSSELAGERRTKQRLVERLHADRSRERSVLVELETSARALEETLARLRGDTGDDSGPLAGPPFTELRGELPDPVDAPLVGEFGRVVDTRFQTETFRKGVEFEAPLGTPVRAVAAGRVRFAGWFRGYGRLVILDHGDNHFTVAGHLDEVGVEVGDAVAAGEAVGSAGETGSLAGPRLYFEIRRGGEALDPRQWLASLQPRG